MAMALEKELATYKKRLEELLSHENQYVVIHGDEIAGIWDRYEEALRQGYERYGLNPFLVQRIQWAEPVHTFTRDINLCR
jgi:hypothetical protein